MAASASTRSSRGWSARDWLLPLLGVVLALVVLGLVYQWLIAPHLFSTGQEPGKQAAFRREALEQRRQNAEKLLAEGSFRLAARELSLVEASVADWRFLSTAEQAQWAQLEKQAALLADLLAEPLEDILQHARGVRAAEWAADFAVRYGGKALVFDAEFHRDAKGRWQIRYPLFIGEERAYLNLDGLEILKRIPGVGPERLLLGVRLKSIQREPPGPVWVVRFESDSGIFLTHAAAVRACTGRDDLEMAKTFERMAGWLEK